MAGPLQQSFVATLLEPSVYKHTPWKNGGGVVIDIWSAFVQEEEEEEKKKKSDSWTGLLWKLGTTSIVKNGPFSDMSGFDRILTVIDNQGLVLEVAGEKEGLDGKEGKEEHELNVRTPFSPVQFPGEAKITSRLEQGPVRVLNLIGARASVSCLAVQLLRNTPTTTTPITTTTSTTFITPTSIAPTTTTSSAANSSSSSLQLVTNATHILYALEDSCISLAGSVYVLKPDHSLHIVANNNQNNMKDEEKGKQEACWELTVTSGHIAVASVCMK